nr:thymidylate kinase 251L [Hymenolepis microstoma]
MSSKSKSSGSKRKSKGSSKSTTKNKEIAFAEVPPVILKDVRCKLVSTSSDLPNYTFQNFRCARCSLVLNTFQSFIDHSCWRKYYSAKYHLGCTQAFACRVCEVLFYSHTDYASHRCFDDKRCDISEWWTPEEVIPISYRQHHDYYINWARKSEREIQPHEPDCNYICRCCKCSRRFKSKIEFILHSCCLFIVFSPTQLRRLKTCMCCKFVFLNEEEYGKHVIYCNPKRAFCIDFALTTAEIACQQFVTGRHCFDFDFHLHNGVGFNSHDKIVDLKDGTSLSSVNCPECGFEQTDLMEFLYHPCVAGKKLSPFNLELILFCCECSYLFVDVFECIEHLKSCSPVSFAFVRINTPNLLRVALRRWSREIDEHPFIPARKEKFRCGDCEEIFRRFDCFLTHLCPRRERYEKLFVQPLGIMETYTCKACHLVLFSISEAIEHSKNCSRECYPPMVQIHYSMEEVIAALTPWTKCPQSLKFDIIIGASNEADERRMVENTILAKNLHESEGGVAQRIEKWISRTICKRVEDRIMLTSEHIKEVDQAHLLE